ncbi:MAG: Peptidyl-prolyl cis-trans isomerase cyp8, partial [Watsoniomyces obsoletus]
PFTTPVCTTEGLIFDHENIIRWLMKHDTNPVNGQPLKQAELIKVNFTKNDAEEYVDPVTYKVLTDNTHIVAVRHGDSANAFAWDTIERLNIKAKMWRDLVTDEEFSRKDVITLQDPQNLESRNLSEFKYLKEGEDAGIPKEQASINTSAMGNAADLKIMKAKDAVAKARAER